MWRPARPEDDDTIAALCDELHLEDPASDPVPPCQPARTLEVLRKEPARGRALVLELDGTVEGCALHSRAVAPAQAMPARSVPGLASSAAPLPYAPDPIPTHADSPALLYEGCNVQAARRWTLPAPEGGTVVATYPFVFSAQE